MSKVNRQCSLRFIAVRRRCAICCSLRGAHLEFHEAVAAGQLERVEHFVDKDADLARAISPDGFPVVALAAAFGHFAIVKYLFEKGADLTAVATNGTGYNALTGAVASGREEIAIWLLENGADANYRYGRDIRRCSRRQRTGT